MVCDDASSTIFFLHSSCLFWFSEMVLQLLATKRDIFSHLFINSIQEIHRKTLFYIVVVRGIIFCLFSCFFGCCDTFFKISIFMHRKKFFEFSWEEMKKVLVFLSKSFFLPFFSFKNLCQKIQKSTFLTKLDKK